MEPASPPRVLVVDDEKSNRTFAERALREAGYEVASAADGPEALDLVERSRPFDLFLVDVQMPRMHGDELARRLRLRDADAKILYFTGYADQLFQQRSVLWTHEAFIEKPVTLSGLLEAVSLMVFGHMRGLRPSAEISRAQR
jgi:two-component system, cell cycle sensor histidine kinase and response regulator CckA